MLEWLRDRIGEFLAQHNYGVLATGGSGDIHATVIRYHSQGINIECLLPRWTDVAYHLQQNPLVVLIVHDLEIPRMRWLSCIGEAYSVEKPDWTTWAPLPIPPSQAAELFLIARILPHRFDLMDESRGWGTRETLELEP